MVVFEKGKVYKHKETGEFREVDYIYDDPKDLRKCVVFKKHGGNYIVNICNDYEYSTVEELNKYINEKKQGLEKIHSNDKRIEIDKSGLKIFDNNDKLIFSINNN
ncbi:MAG: hypothetical protein DBY38_02225 [Clostridium cadaveris]|uniref:Uncharacterized protein n=1 Tax=Clostridium cadaveris TaxID=1529 RepID=A0A316MBW4_9CLOT|nr:MAG: hypothetical protein DBY38_02225 [Clostridium cadaveris]